MPTLLFRVLFLLMRILDEPIYIGAIPWLKNATNSTSFKVPPTLWTASLQKGFVGCLRNFRVNGISSEIASAYDDQKKNFGDGKWSINFSGNFRAQNLSEF